MDIMDCQSFLLLKKKITETDELITKCQFLQNQLELVQRDQAKQQMELKSMENENALLQSAKRKYESQFHQHMGSIKGYENLIKQCNARINELEKLQEKDSALIKTLQAERDTAVSENRKVVSNRVRNVKARSKQTQTELLVDIGSEGKIIIPSFQVNCRQRRRRSRQAVSSSTEARELICKNPTIILPPAERASTPKSSCSEGDGSSDGEDITENEMPWLTEITEQPAETAMCDVAHTENELAEINKQPVETSVCDVAYSESELDESSENLLLPYNTMDMSISPLPPTPSMNLDDESTRRTDTSKDVGTELDHNISECDLMKECHLTSDSSVVLDNDNETIEESTLISSHQLSNDSDTVVVATDSANLLLEKASGSPILRTLSKESLEVYSGILDADEKACKSPTLCSNESANMAAPSSTEASVLNSSKSVVAPSPPPAEAPALNSPKSLVAPSPPSVEAPILNSPKSLVAPSPPQVEAPVLKSPKSLVTPSSCSKPSDLPTVPVFVSHVPTGLTSPVAVRTGFGKGAKDKNTYPSFMVDPRRDSTIYSTFKKDNNKLNTAKRIGSLSRRSSPQSSIYFSSIAERTRSQASRRSHGTLPTPKVTKQAERQLNKLEITMNTFKSHQSSTKLQNREDTDAIQNQEANGNSILPVDRCRKDNGKRKRPLNQPRADLKKKCHIANSRSQGRNYGRAVSGKPFDQQIPLSMDRISKDYRKGNEIIQDDKIESIENDNNLEAGIDLNISEGKLDKREVSFDENNEDLDDKRIVEDKQKGVNDESKLNEAKKDDAAMEEKIEGNCEEDKNVVELAKAKQVSNEGENVDEGEFDNIEDEGNGEGKNANGEEDRRIDRNTVENDSIEEMLIDVNESESDQERNEVENMDSSLENGELVVEDSGEEECEEEARNDVVESRSRREVEKVKEVGNRGKLGDKLECKGELLADKNEVENEETLQRDKSIVELDDRSGSKEKFEDESKEEAEQNRSDGELDSEEDPSSSSNQMPEATLNSSPKISPEATTNVSPKKRPVAPINASSKINASPRKRQELFTKDKPARKLSKSASILSMSGTSSGDDDDTFDLSCPLLKDAKLPGWLEWTINEEEKASTTIQHSFIRGQKQKKGKNRRMKSQSQKKINYLLVNLEHLLLKTAKLEKILDKFSDPRNVDSTSDFANAISKFIVEALHPSFENVASKLAERCNKAVSHNAKIFPHYKPLDENFHPVMLTFESRIVAILMIVEKHNPKLNNLMGCVADTLRCTLFVSLEDNNIDVHKQCSLIRVITAISRAVGKVDFMQRLCLDLISLSRPLKISQLPLLQAVAGVWPLVLARREGVKLYGLKEVIPEGLEPQIVSHTVEVTTCYLIGKQDQQEFGHLLFKTFVSFCKWQQLSEASMRSLANALVKILTSSPNVMLNSYDSTNQGKWISPQLSATTHMCITCLAVIGKYLGWKWISDSLIREQLWPLLQKWSRKTMGQEVSEPVITAITQLIGLVGKQGVLHDPTSQSVRQLQKMLSSLLQRAHDSPEVTLSIQLAVAESLISLCHPSQLPVAKDVLQKWLTGIKTHHPYAAQTIWEDFAPRVWSMRTVTNDSTSDEKTY